MIHSNFLELDMQKAVYIHTSWRSMWENANTFSLLGARWAKYVYISSLSHSLLQKPTAFAQPAPGERFPKSGVPLNRGSWQRSMSKRLQELALEVHQLRYTRTSEKRVLQKPLYILTARCSLCNKPGYIHPFGSSTGKMCIHTYK